MVWCLEVSLEYLLSAELVTEEIVLDLCIRYLRLWFAFVKANNQRMIEGLTHVVSVHSFQESLALMYQAI